MSSRSRQQLEEWIRRQDLHGKIADVGGSQNPIWKRGVCDRENVTVIDLETPHEGEKPDLVIDIEQLGAVMMTDGMYDTVTCLEMFEYVIDPLTALRNINLLMKRGGELFISFHWLYGLHPPKGTDCLRYSYYGIQRLLSMAGFLIEDMEVRTLSDEGKTHLARFYSAEGMRIDRHDDSVYDSGYLIKATKV